MGKQNKTNSKTMPAKKQKVKGKIKQATGTTKGKVLQDKTPPKHIKPIITFCWLIAPEDFENFADASRSYSKVKNIFGSRAEYLFLHDGAASEGMIIFENTNHIVSGTYIWSKYKSFAEMRNLALSLCKTDYIFFIDADERLIIDDIDKFLTMLKDAKPEYAIINVMNERDNKNENTEYNLIRLLNTKQHFIYENVVMEDMRKSLRKGMKFWGIPKNKLQIIHTGYSNDDKVKQKLKYQIKMLLDAIEIDDKKDDRMILALMRMREGSLSLAVKEYEYIIKTYSIENGELKELYNKISQLYFQLADMTPSLFRDAFDYANKSLQIDDTQALPTFLIAEVYFAGKHYNDAAAAYRAAYLKLVNTMGNKK